MSTIQKTSVMENQGEITTPKLIRWSGFAAIGAGLIFGGIQPFHPPDVLASVNTSAFLVITSLKTIMSIFGLFGIAGLYARQVKETGWLGLAGYLLLTIFFAVQMCFSFIEPLILPLLTNEAPAFVESVMGMASGAGGPMNLGALAAVNSLLSVLYLLSLLLFGTAMFRARILPRWAALLLALSGPLAGAMVALLPHHLERLAALPTGIALVWLGFALLTERRERFAEALPESKMTRVEPSKAA